MRKKNHSFMSLVAVFRVLVHWNITGKKSQYTCMFSTFTIPQKVTVCIMSDFVHTQVMVFIATFIFLADMVAFCFIITIYFKFCFILINNNIWSAHTVHTYYLITRTNINLIFELCKLITGKQIRTPQLPKAHIFILPIISHIESAFYFCNIR
jgi:hypothetical protein